MIFNKTTLSLLAITGGVLFMAWLFSDIVLYFVISMVLAGILKTPTNYISQTQIGNFRIPRVTAILTSFGILAGIIFLFILIFKPLVSDQIKVVSEINYDTLLLQISDPITRFERFLIKNNIMHESEGFIMNSITNKIATLGEELKFGDIINGVISTTGNFLIAVIAVLFITFFLLFEKGIIRRNILAIVPNAYFEVTISALYKIEKLLSNYLLGLLLQMLSVFTVVSFGLILGGVKYAVTIGVFAAVANLIPFIGPFIGAIFGLIVGLSTTAPELAETVLMGGYIFLSIKILTVFAFVQLTDNLMLQPIIFSKSVKAHPLEIFIIVFAGATLAGAIGMIAAIPTYTVLRVSFLELQKGYKQYRIFKYQKLFSDKQ